jgi:hypothetical protein
VCLLPWITSLNWKSRKKLQTWHWQLTLTQVAEEDSSVEGDEVEAELLEEQEEASVGKI